MLNHRQVDRLHSNIIRSASWGGISLNTEEVFNALQQYKTGMYEDVNHFMFRWVPSIKYELLGRDRYVQFRPKLLNASSYFLLNPYFYPYEHMLEEKLKSLEGVHIEKLRYRFTKDLILGLYGGFDWFFVYFKLCDDLKLWNQNSWAYKVTSEGKIDVAGYITNFKNKDRRENSQFIVKKEYPGNKLSGVIHLYHTPEPIENKQHCHFITDNIVGDI